MDFIGDTNTKMRNIFFMARILKSVLALALLSSVGKQCVVAQVAMERVT